MTDSTANTTVRIRVTMDGGCHHTGFRLGIQKCARVALPEFPHDVIPTNELARVIELQACIRQLLGDMRLVYIVPKTKSLHISLQPVLVLHGGLVRFCSFVLGFPVIRRRPDAVDVHFLESGDLLICFLQLCLDPGGFICGSLDLCRCLGDDLICDVVRNAQIRQKLFFHSVHPFCVWV